LSLGFLARLHQLDCFHLKFSCKGFLFLWHDLFPSCVGFLFQVYLPHFSGSRPECHLLQYGKVHIENAPHEQQRLDQFGGRDQIAQAQETSSSKTLRGWGIQTGKPSCHPDDHCLHSFLTSAITRGVHKD
jgi:hypothetical protein